jgi:hypothetical protein
MAEEILIVKKEGTRMTAKLRRRVRKGYAPDSYMKVVNPYDYNDLALLLEDLDLLIGAPVEKAFQAYRKNRQKGYPFF